MADYARAIELKPDYVDAYYNRGSAKQTRGDLDGAIADYSKAIELKPEDIDIYSNRGNARKAKGDFNGAMADFTKVIELKPDNVEASRNRGCLRYDLHDFKGALTDFRMVVELDSANDYARFRIWLVRARLGQATAATSELQTYLAARANEKPVDWAPKIGHFLTGQLPEPEFLDAAKNADPGVRAGRVCEAYFYAGSKHLFAGDQSSAMEYFQSSIASNKRTYLELRLAQYGGSL